MSPPVELPDQRGRDRLDKRLHVFAAMVAATLEDGQGGAVEAGVSIFATPEETGRQGKAKQSRYGDLRPAANEPAVIGMRANRRAAAAAKDILFPARGWQLFAEATQCNG